MSGGLWLYSPTTSIGRGLKPLDARTNPHTRLVGLIGGILMVKTKIKLITTNLNVVPRSMIQYRWNTKLSTNTIHESIFFFFYQPSKIAFYIHQNQAKNDEHMFFTISPFLMESFFLTLIAPPILNISLFLCNLFYDIFDILKNNKTKPSLFSPLFTLSKIKRNRI